MCKCGATSQVGAVTSKFGFTSLVAVDSKCLAYHVRFQLYASRDGAIVPVKGDEPLTAAGLS